MQDLPGSLYPTPLLLGSHASTRTCTCTHYARTVSENARQVVWGNQGSLRKFYFKKTCNCNFNSYTGGHHAHGPAGHHPRAAGSLHYEAYSPWLGWIRVLVAESKSCCGILSGRPKAELKYGLSSLKGVSWTIVWGS